MSYYNRRADYIGGFIISFFITSIVLNNYSVLDGIMNWLNNNPIR